MIREACRQFADNVSTLSWSFAKVASIPPPKGITKTDLEAALQSVTAQFTTIVQSLVSEICQTILGLSETLIQPLQTICKELQTKPVSKSPLLSLSTLPTKKSKKFQSSHPTDLDSSLDMDTQQTITQDFSANCLQSVSPTFKG